MYQIARGLIADKVPTLMGGKWAQGTIANLLRHQSLRGSATIKGQKLDNFYPPVITQLQWMKLQAKLRENRNRKGGDANYTDIIANLFRNRLYVTPWSRYVLLCTTSPELRPSRIRNSSCSRSRFFCSRLTRVRMNSETLE